MIEFVVIGVADTIITEDNHKVILIKLHNEYAKACIKLALFSHCLILSKDDNRIYCSPHKIISVNEKIGELVVEKPELIGEIIDIKPYFPCEDTILDYPNHFEEGKAPLKGNKTSTRYITEYRGNFIGKYILVQNKQFISIDDIQVSYKKLDEVSKGDYLRILWWFHRFDKKAMRDNRMCQPPYKDAPKTGIFATRSPVRPNPIASTIVKVESVDKVNGLLGVCGFDGFEESQILQIMKYNFETDKIIGVHVPEWVSAWTNHKTFLKAKDIKIEDQGIEPINSKNSMIEEVDYFEELEEENNSNTKVNYSEINVVNASIHNLKNISVTIPKKKITIITGVSGSGKSSLAFDTIYEESKKQFMDLVSTNSLTGAELNDTKVERITGLQPAIAIEQRNLGQNPRSTVGSVSQTSSFLKLLFATIGTRICPNCHEEVGEDLLCKSCETIFFTLTPQQFGYNHPDYMCPVCKGLGMELQIDTSLIIDNPTVSILDGASTWWGNMRKHREKPNANWMRGEVLALALDMGVDLELPYEKLPMAYKKQILYGSNGREVSLEYKNPNGRSGRITRPVEGVVNAMYRLLKDNKSEKAMSYIEKYLTKTKCTRCEGERLHEEGRLVHIHATRFPEIMNMNIRNLRDWCHKIYGELTENERLKTVALLQKTLFRLKKINQVGLGYVSLNRSIPSLSGGEAQRLKIATQFGSGLTNILYIMDEPSKGLHPKDYQFLLKTIDDLKSLDNTVLMVEHKKHFLQIADYHLEMGPRAGKYGGEIVSRKWIDNNNIQSTLSDTNDYQVRDCKMSKFQKRLTIKGAKTNNLKNLHLTIPLGKFVSVIGVSGSGKSSLVVKTIYTGLLKNKGHKVDYYGEYDELIGCEYVKEIFLVNQKAIGKNIRSNPATYTGVFDLIRTFYAKTNEAKKMKFTKEHFSFNSSKGQCPECKGLGKIHVPMHYMEDIYVICTKCLGNRYKESVLGIKVDGYSIWDLLDMEISEVAEIFKEEKRIFHVLEMLMKVGLGYIKLGQSATTLSGGEAQRIKLAKELSLGNTEDILYILDEPTTGLHDDDIKCLIQVLQELRDGGASVIVIEHNPQLINESDWIVEMGPAGGELGGKVIQEGWLKKNIDI